MHQSDKQAKPLPKRARGRTTIDDTQLITHTRIGLSEVTRTSIEERLRRALAPFGPRISHGTIRLVDLNGPRGGVDLRCTIEIVLDAGDRIQIEQCGTSLLEAVRRAIPRAVRGVRLHVERSGHRTPRPTSSLRDPAPAQLTSAEPSRQDAGSNGKHTSARHDGRQNDSGMTYALEDSQGKPSRKSTRASSNHIKAASQLTRRVQRKLQSPQARAAKSAA